MTENEDKELKLLVEMAIYNMPAEEFANFCELSGVEDPEAFRQSIKRAIDRKTN